MASSGNVVPSLLRTNSMQWFLSSPLPVSSDTCAVACVLLSIWVNPRLLPTKGFLEVHITATFSDDPNESCPEWCGVFDSVVLVGRRVVRFQMKNITCIKNDQSRLRPSVQCSPKRLKDLETVADPDVFHWYPRTLTETDALTKSC